MCCISLRCVGGSKVPAIILVQPEPSLRGRQKRLPPHRPQKPLCACSDEENHTSVPSFSSVMRSDSAPVAATKWPLVRRHCEQWQAMTSRREPCTVYRTPPHR